jgi:translation initiation factor 2B subunit (eIF-2B alpha/beta/delta family)
MREHLRAQVDIIRADKTSGATDIVLRAAGLLRQLLEESGQGDEAAAVARECVRAQPAMAGLLGLEAIARGPDPASAIARFQEQVRRAPAAIARHASQILLLDSGPSNDRRQIRLVTCSSSRAVESTLIEVARGAALTVCCAESRPKCEGVALAGRLASVGLVVQLFSDAGISSAVSGSDGVLVGADAVGPEFFINKVGTGALCALASSQGVPVYVLAGREKLLNALDVARLELAEGHPDEVSEQPPAGVSVRNPYFERVPLNLATIVITDAGIRPAQPEEPRVTR